MELKRILIFLRQRIHLGRSFLLIMVASSYFQAFSQQPPEAPKMEVIPPSPEASGLGKYGTIPVGYHTGVPSISVPIYTIKTKKLQVPISINYHASGIKVNDISSWIGTGWSLMAGGSITRSVVGLNDHYPQGFLNRTVKKKNDYTVNDYEEAYNVATALSDGESDYYFYNFAGKSGKFIFDDTESPFTIPKEPIDIQLVQDGFEITDIDGTVYEFTSIEYMSSGQNAEYLQIQYASTWHLTEIRSADNSDSIQFVYDTDGLHKDYSYFYSETIGDTYTGTALQQNEHDKPGPSQSFRDISPLRLKEVIFSEGNGKVEFFKTSDRLDLDSSRLSRIEISEYDPQNQTYDLIQSFDFENDNYFTNGSSHRLKLAGLDENDRLGNRIKEHNFTYNSTPMPNKGNKAQDFWGYHNGKTTNTSLVPTKIIPFLGFNYSVGAANRTPDQDAMKAGILERIDYPTGGYTEFDFEAHRYNELGIVRKDTIIKAVQSEKIITITPDVSGWSKILASFSNVTDASPYFSRLNFKESGASTSLINFDYDPYEFPAFDPILEKNFDVYLNANTIYELKISAFGNSDSTQEGGNSFVIASINYDTQSTEYKMAGGLRVQQIRSYPDQNSEPIVRTYTYGSNESGFGTMLIYPNWLSTQEIEKPHRYWYLTNPGGFCVYNETQRKTINGSPVFDLTTLNGSSVVYPEVTEYFGTEIDNQGKKIYEFEIFQDEIQSTLPIYKNGSYQIDNSWKSGSLLSDKHQTDTGQPTKETFNSNATLFTETEWATKVNFSAVNHGCFTYGSHNFNESFYIFDYPVHSGSRRVVSTQDTIYSSNNSNQIISISNSFEYANTDHQQLTKTTTHNSENQLVETKFWYPQDYNNIENIETLVNNHVIGVPIKQETTVAGNQTGGSITKYDDFGNIEEAFAFEKQNLQPPAAHNPSTYIPGSQYQSRLKVEYENLTENVAQVTKDDAMDVTYIWGYKNQHPIAKIENAKYADLNQSVVADLKTKSNEDNDRTIGSLGKEGVLRSALENLRNILPNAMVTTYTYDPIIGATSMTDPRGYTIYYNYDDFNRLKEVRDADNNLVTDYKYHYKNQQ